ncbi:MAG: phosphatase PAP2 family protein, partial [Verrucomicrobiaceae bacterium]
PYQSFPSGHVACTLAAACAVGSVYPQTRGAGAVATGVIAVARLVKGAHWPLDILGGLAVGAVASSFVAGLFKMQGSWEARRR